MYTILLTHLPTQPKTHTHHVILTNHESSAVVYVWLRKELVMVVYWISVIMRWYAGLWNERAQNAGWESQMIIIIIIIIVSIISTNLFIYLFQRYQTRQLTTGWRRSVVVVVVVVVVKKSSSSNWIIINIIIIKSSNINR